MIIRTQRDKDWFTRYYEGAVGLTVVGVKWSQEGEPLSEQMPVLICRAPDRERVELELSQDPEGNGPGFLFGLPEPLPSDQPNERPFTKEQVRAEVMAQVPGDYSPSDIDDIVDDVLAGSYPTLKGSVDRSIQGLEA